MRNPNTTCHQCGAACYVRPGQMANQKVWFCSKACHQNSVIQNLSTCATCGESFKKANADSKYCSRSCANVGRRGILYDGANKKNKAYAVGIRRRNVLDAYGPNCAICGGEPIWLGRPLQHQVDHIDGNNKNHDINNLRFLCPNCHTQTETYGPKNIGRYKSCV